jgi:hypothetical protein
MAAAMPLIALRTAEAIAIPHPSFAATAANVLISASRACLKPIV